jgi:hypothetical protein
MSLIIFNTGHALLLSELRVLRPRSSRGGAAKWPRKFIVLSPQTRRIQKREPAALRTRPRTVHVRGQSTVTFSPGAQPVQRRGQGLAFAIAKNSAQTDNDQRLSMSAFPVPTKTDRVLQQAVKYPHQGIGTSTLLRHQCPTSSQPIPYYAHI